MTSTGTIAPTSRRDALIVAAVVAIGAALRLYRIGAPSIWLDEALSIEYARLAWPDFAHLMQARELNMLPYYLLLRAWIHLGTGEAIVRTLSALCSIATLPLFYRLGVRLFGARAGLIGVAILAIHPYHIRFAQEARGYSLMLLLVTASTLLLVRAADSTSPQRTRIWVGHVAASALAAYAHFFASLVLLAQWVALAILRPRTLRAKELALAIAAIAMLLIPLAAFVLFGHADPAGWIPQPSVKRVEYLVYSLLGGDNTHGARPFAYPVYIIALFAWGACARAALRAPNRETEGWRHVLVACGAALPILLVLAASMVKPFFVDKYLIECLPFVVLVLAAGIEYSRPRALAVALLVGTLAISTHALHAYYGHSDKDDWRSATRYVLASSRDGDAVLFFPSYEIASYEYYRSSIASSAPAVVYPGALGGGKVRDALSQLPHGHARLWAIFNQDGEAGTAVRDSLAHRFHIVSDREFTGVRVVLYDMR